MTLEQQPISQEPADLHQRQDGEPESASSTNPVNLDQPQTAFPHPHGSSHRLRAESMSSSRSEGYNPWADTLEVRSGRNDQHPDFLQSHLEQNRVPERASSAGPPAEGRDVQQPYHENQDAIFDSPFAAPRSSHSANNSVQIQSNNPFLKAVQQRNSGQSFDDSSNAQNDVFAPATPALAYHNEPEHEAPQPQPPPQPQFDPPRSASPFLDGPSMPSISVSHPYTDPSPSYQSHDFQEQTHDAQAPPPPLPKDNVWNDVRQLQQGESGDERFENISRATSQRQEDSPGADRHPNIEPIQGSTPSNPVAQDLIDLGQDGVTTQQSAPHWLEGPRDLMDSEQLDRSHEPASSSGSNLDTQREAGRLSPPEASREPPMTESQIRQREAILAETYDIRTVNWTDGTTELRQSPVLVQNENGPCPLLALVNGLVLRTQPGLQSPLIKTLNSREKISLSLLIYALFDELTTYVDEESQLPDIGDLSTFLTILHTGMNVNPRLTAITSPEDRPGTFLETRDTNLYRTFNLPLVHGWLAPPSSPAHSALVRVAEYHDDIQLLHFQKEELEDKASRGTPLTSEDLQLIQDIETIQHFVNVENATQLSRFGLDHLNRCTAPGSISILFRNDHFATLFKHPLSHQLFTLVTDMGYARHAEIVWESLVDVNGRESELFSGDFRPVGHSSSSSSWGPQNNQRRDEPATTPRRNNATTSTTADSQEPSTEQTDADYAYALALQFQDEEEQREREQNNNNNNNNNRSSTSAAAPSVNRARSHGTAQYDGTRNSRSQRRGRPSVGPQPQSSVRSLIPHTEPTSGEDPNAPPPTYEQAAKSPAYIPPADHPQYPGYATISGPRTSSQGFQATSGRPAGGPNLPMDRLRQMQANGHSTSSLPDRSRDRERKDCIVM